MALLLSFAIVTVDDDSFGGRKLRIPAEERKIVAVSEASVFVSFRFVPFHSVSFCFVLKDGRPFEEEASRRGQNKSIQ